MLKINTLKVSDGGGRGSTLVSTAVLKERHGLWGLVRRSRWFTEKQKSQIHTTSEKRLRKTR